MSQRHSHPIATTHPDLASELVVPEHGVRYTAGSAVQLEWKCSGRVRPDLAEHTYTASPNTRTHGHGCPVCAGQQVCVGVNDLATTHPETASQLVDDELATTLHAGSSREVEWSCEGDNEHPHPTHRYVKSVRDKVRLRGRCAVCTGRRILIGHNDLATEHPTIAAELKDPALATQLRSGSNKEVEWLCFGTAGHPHARFEYSATVKSRTKSGGGCPACAGHAIIAGYNDLQSTHPGLTANLVDPPLGAALTPGSPRSVSWWCEGTADRPHERRTFDAEVKARTRNNVGCGYCAGRRVLPGFNDVATSHPDLVAELENPEVAKQHTAGSQNTVAWICPEAHRYSTTIYSRTSGSGCPRCATRGFDRTSPGWLYLMERPGELQIGITNHLEDRMRVHRRQGWSCLDAAGPFEGNSLLQCEKLLRHWIKDGPGRMPGTWENWASHRYPATDLARLLINAEIGWPTATSPECEGGPGQVT